MIDLISQHMKEMVVTYQADSAYRNQVLTHATALVEQKASL